MVAKLIEECTKEELQLVLRAAGQSTAGTKSDLLLRLTQEIRNRNGNVSDPIEIPTATASGSGTTSTMATAPDTAYRVDLPPPANFTISDDDPGVATRWKKWLRSFEIYISAMGSIPDSQKLNILLHVAGPQVQELYSTFESSDCDTYKTLIDCLEKQFIPKQNTRYERWKFRCCAQTSTETLDTYVLRLRKLAETCKFADGDDSILDQIIEKGRDTAIRKKLLERGDSLSLPDALGIARTHEHTTHQLRDIECRSSNHTAAEVDAVSNNPSSNRSASRNRSNVRDVGSRRNFNSPYRGRERSMLTQRGNNASTTSTSKKCFRCGSSDHLANFRNCPARNAECGSCRKPGHYSRVCRSKEQSGVNGVDNSDNTVHVVSSVNSTKAMIPFTMHFMKKKCTLLGLLDSGTSYSLIPLPVLRRAVNTDRISFTPTAIRLTGFSGEDIPVCGTIPCKIIIDNQSVETTFIVTKVGSNILLGLDLIRELNITDKIAGDTVASVSSPAAESIGLIKNHVHKVRINPDVKPIREKLRPIPYALRPAVRDEIQRLLNEGVIEKTSAPTWLSNPVVSMKKNGKIRLCVDLRNPNKAVITDVYPIPRVEDLMHKMNGKTIFSIIDLSEAYLQLFPLHVESRDLTSFIHEDGAYRFTRVPYGLSSAPSAFQSMLCSILNDIPDANCFFGDVILASSNISKHEMLKKQVLQRFTDVGLKINLDKSIFNQPSVEFLGFTVDAEGVRPARNKVAALIDSPLPQTAGELRTLLGALGFYSKFIRNWSTLVAPLRDILNENSKPFALTQDNIALIKRLKLMISQSQALTPYDPNKPVILSTDASSVGIGGTIFHVDPSTGKTSVIEFASRTLSKSERKFSTIEKEGLAIVWACEKWRPYLLCREFIIETDRQPLQLIFGTKGYDRVEHENRSLGCSIIPVQIFCEVQERP